MDMDDETIRKARLLSPLNDRDDEIERTLQRPTL
jgi:hypothetical protein